ncbi:TIGR03435 family protein [Telmatobacter bradus]|uniref:TIGR03435 family protein n=1 Tax=Telmatobacter bradus TaxID=474953 RepID=UPI003B428FD7
MFLKKMWIFGVCWVALAGVVGAGGQIPSMMSMPQPKDATPAEVKLSNLAGKSFHYEVVSIKPHKADDPGMSWRTTPNGFAFVNMPLRNLVQPAYGIKLEEAVVGLPKWAIDDRYDIEAKIDDDTTALAKKLSREDRRTFQQMLMQDLLADQLKFREHTETRQLAAYDLIVAKGGVKMKESAPDVIGQLGTSSKGSLNEFHVKGFPMSSFANNLTSNIGKTVVDKTGLLEKKFDFSLTYTRDELQGTPDAGPGLFTALEEQLGLKLVASKAPVEVVIVNHIERPSEN